MSLNGGASVISEALKQMRGGSSGHWGLISTAASVTDDMDPDTFRGLHEKGMFLLNVQVIDSTRLRFGTEDIISIGDSQKCLREKIAAASAEGFRGIRVIVSQFELLPLVNQCTLLLETRGLRESCSDLTCQFLICGCWNFYKVKDYWRTEPSLSSVASPVLDSNKRFFVPGFAVEGIISELRSRSITGQALSEVKQVCAELLHEVTGGDAFLVTQVLSQLAITRRPLMDSVERALEEVVEFGTVLDEIERRFQRLLAHPRELLRRVLRYGTITTASDDEASEDLRLMGLVSVAPTDGFQVRLAIAAPMVDHVLRSNPNRFGFQRAEFSGGANLAWSSRAINAAAYRVVETIETTLRNLIVRELAAANVWPDALSNVRTLSSDVEEQSREIGQLVVQFVEAQMTQRGLIVPPPGTEPPETPSPPKGNKISILDAARDWQKRSDQNTALDLSNASLITFLTTEALASVLLNEKSRLYPLYFKQTFPRKEELIQFLEQFVGIRAAVAHNQPLAIATLRRLMRLLSDLNKRIAIRASQATTLVESEESPGASDR